MIICCLYAEKLSKQEVAAALQKVLQGKINTQNFKVKIEEISNDISSDDCIEDKIDDLEIPAQQRSFKVLVKLKNGEKSTISGKIEWLTNIPILLRPISANDIISQSDLGTQDYPVDDLKPSTVLEIKDLIGKSASNTVIKPNLPVEMHALKNPKIVKRGSIVEVVYRKSSLVISTKATATQDLAMGDTGTFEILKTADSKTLKRIAAQVVGAGTAEITHG
jgi:flagella basal body P-ring formation protein FlgA